MYEDAQVRALSPPSAGCPAHRGPIAPGSDRVRPVQSGIGYPAATAAMDRLESILHHARARRMENCLLIGDSNNGKSTIRETFAARHSDPVRLREPDGLTGHRPLSVVLIKMQRRPTRPCSGSDPGTHALRAAPRSENLMRYTCAILDRLEVRMLMIDDCTTSRACHHATGCSCSKASAIAYVCPLPQRNTRRRGRA